MVRMNILFKLLLFLCLTFFISFALMYLFYHFGFSSYSVYVQDKAEELLMDKYKYGLKNTTEVAVTLLHAILNLENLSETEKLNLAKQLIRPLQFGKEGYYFVYEKDTGVNVIHGSTRELEGQNLWDLQDPGKTQYFIRDLDRVAKEGSLFHEYLWPKRRDDRTWTNENFPKLGTAMMVPGTKYWVGTGEYIDDINNDKNSLMAAINKITGETRIKILAGLGVLSALVIAVIILLARHLTLPIKKLINSTKRISEGNYDAYVKVVSHDEVGELAQLFNEMVKTIKDYTENLEKKVKDRTVELQEAMDKLHETNKILEGLSEKLSRYLPSQIKDSILSGKHEVKIQSKRKKLTIFFSDIKDFTQTTNRMETEALTSLLNNYLDEMACIALKYSGTIDKYIGDAILIFFGDPESKGIEQDALAAVSMGIEMRNRIQELQEYWLNHGIAEPFHVRMGINTGYCTVGNFGSEDRMDYTIIGSQVNLASRMELTATPDQILISHETYTLIKDRIFCKKKDVIHVKGVDYPVQTYEVVDFHENVDKQVRLIQENIDGFKVNADLGQVNKENKQRILKALKKAFDTIKGL